MTKRLILVSVCTLMILGCGRETRTAISGGDGGPGRKGDGGKVTKLQRIQREALSASVMTLTRFGELEEILRLSLEDPRQALGQMGCPEVASVVESNDRDNRSVLRAEMHWENCAGAWQTLGHRVVQIYRSEPNKDAISGNVAAISIELKPGRQIWKSQRNQNYESTAASYWIEATDCTQDCSANWRQQFTVFDQNAFALTRGHKDKSGTWSLTAEQTLSGTFVFLNKEFAPEPMPSSRFIWTAASTTSRFVQLKQDRSEMITDQIQLDLTNSSAETNACGSLAGQFAVRLKSDRHNEVLSPEQPLTVEAIEASGKFDTKFTDPFGNSYNLRNCLDEANSLPFVKANVEGLSSYNVRM
ncbi:MAG: hypothetical protein HRT45_19395 [Bdellovibrionales bacterium]|nr:hypothetical protein [Bdellovibrionales bacterium]